MILEDNHLYTPEEVADNGWLGSDATPEALRKATRRKKNPLPCTRFPSAKGRIYFTRANILAIQEAAVQDARRPENTERRSPQPTQRRGRRSPVSAVPDLPPGTTPLVPKPQSARKRRAS